MSFQNTFDYIALRAFMFDVKFGFNSVLCEKKAGKLSITCHSMNKCCVFHILVVKKKKKKFFFRTFFSLQNIVIITINRSIPLFISKIPAQCNVTQVIIYFTNWVCILFPLSLIRLGGYYIVIQKKSCIYLNSFERFLLFGRC